VSLAAAPEPGTVAVGAEAVAAHGQREGDLPGLRNIL